MVSIVDVDDALRSNRVYRAALDENTVLDMMQEDCGIKFDPKLFDLFTKHLDPIREILKAPELQDLE